MPTPPSDRAVRIAENESRFREINHRLARDVEAVAVGDDLVGFVCECGRPACTDALPLTLAEYRGIREDPMRFAVLPGHELPDVEDVVEAGERYVVIRKHEPTRRIAERRDPA